MEQDCHIICPWQKKENNYSSVVKQSKIYSTAAERTAYEHEYDK